MRISVALIALATLAVAFPTQSPFANTFDSLIPDAERLILAGKSNLDRWVHGGKHFIKQNDQMYELVTHPSLKEYRLRLKQPQLCDPSVKQYSGYLDIAEDKSLFFWYFDSRSSPETDPLVLWLNGGPGCSSSTGLLFELGPCSIANEGHNTTHNPRSWTNHANMIFLDQPVNVGYSYSKDGTTVSSSAASGADVHAFLQLFYKRFDHFKGRPFHVAAESYGGHYAPNIANVVYKRNKELANTLSFAPINLASVILANGLTNPHIQYGSIADYVCDGPFPVFEPDSTKCASLRAKIPTCQRLINSCNRFNSRLTCVPAILYCNAQLFGPLMQTGLNPYDVRIPCDRQTDGDLCYKQLTWVDVWMNDPVNKIALGADPSKTFASCNMDVNKDFTLQGDGVKNSATLLPEMIDDGVRLLVYAGNADMMCNYLGNERWVEALPTQFTDEFASNPSKEWYTLATGSLAGRVRSAGGKGLRGGNVTFVEVFDAGHMVPYDQPEAAEDMFTRWILDLPLA